jgi:hypothetical protein
LKSSLLKPLEKAVVEPYGFRTLKIDYIFYVVITEYYICPEIGYAKPEIEQKKRMKRTESQAWRVLVNSGRGELILFNFFIKRTSADAQPLSCLSFVPVALFEHFP